MLKVVTARKKDSEEEGSESVEQVPRKQLKKGKCGWLDTLLQPQISNLSNFARISSRLSAFDALQLIMSSLSSTWRLPFPVQLSPAWGSRVSNSLYSYTNTMYTVTRAHVCCGISPMPM